MIRKELKIDPVGYICKSMDGVYLNGVEQLYLVNKCPKLFKHINAPNKWAQRLYVRRCEPMAEIYIEGIQDKKAFSKALKKNPRLCVNLDMNDFENDISLCVNMLHKMGSKDILTRLIADPLVTNNIVRKIIFLEPMLVDTAIKNSTITIDEEMERYIFNTNPLLLRGFKKISENTVNYIVSKGLRNIIYIEQFIELVRNDVMTSAIIKELTNINHDIFDYTYTLVCIRKFPHLFGDIIKTLYKNGLNKKTNFTLRFLLKELNELIDDQLASFILEMEEE